MPLVDLDMAWKYGYKFLPVTAFFGFDHVDIDTGTGSSPAGQASFGAGTPPWEEVNAGSEISALAMDEGDEVYSIMPLNELDINRAQNMSVRVHWIHEAAAADTGIIWKLHYQLLERAAAVADFVANADEVVTIPDATGHTVSATADTYELTNWATVTITSYITPQDEVMGFGVELDADGDASATENQLLGIEFRWVRQATGQVRKTS